MKCIIHVAINEEPGDPAQAWQRVVKRALTEAEKRKLQSIAFPALGTGVSDINRYSCTEQSILCRLMYYTSPSPGGCLLMSTSASASMLLSKLSLLLLVTTAFRKRSSNAIYNTCTYVSFKMHVRNTLVLNAHGVHKY